CVYARRLSCHVPAVLLSHGRHGQWLVCPNELIEICSDRNASCSRDLIVTSGMPSCAPMSATVWPRQQARTTATRCSTDSASKASDTIRLSNEVIQMMLRAHALGPL